MIGVSEGDHSEVDVRCSSRSRIDSRPWVPVDRGTCRAPCHLRFDSTATLHDRSLEIRCGPWTVGRPSSALTRCAVYTRQSVVGRGGDPALTSCQLQRDACLEFIRTRASQLWCPISERFDDEGWSGANAERPALERLFQRIQEGAIDRIVVYRMDRLTRNVTDWARIAGLAQRFNVGLTVASGAIDAEGGALARLQLNVLATFAQLEREMFGDRLRDARAARKARGERSSGRVPLGYRSAPRTKQLVVMPEEAVVIRSLFEQAASGQRPSEIAEIANATPGLTTGGHRGPWSARSVLRVLQNPVYVGKRPDGSPGAHPAIVDDEHFQRVQAMIAGRRSRLPSSRSNGEDREDPFLLRGLVLCEHCKRTMTTSASTAITRRTASRTPRYYRCRTQRCEGGQVAAFLIEERALEILRRPPSGWEPREREKLKRFASIWDVLRPMYRRQALLDSFESFTWRSRTSRLVAKPRALAISQEGSEP